MSVKIHPTAIVDSKAQIGINVEIGAYSIIAADVIVGDRTSIGPHVVLKGPTTIGVENRIFQFCSIGEECQDKKYNGEPTQLIIGDRNTIREFATMQRGTIQDESATRIGNDNWFMAYTHVAHDCVVGSNTIFANGATLAGHVKVGDGVILGGFAAIHQFCHVGEYAMVAMCSAINKDVPAYLMVQGNMAKVRGMNLEGMRRRKLSKSVIQTLQKAYDVVYRQSLTVQQALAELTSWTGENSNPELDIFIKSITQSTRGIIR
ncbi:MAG: acyl-ACP--UDP-N-acetylglucosamine O-acyltransferase [Pseudomonadota bacterium]